MLMPGKVRKIPKCPRCGSKAEFRDKQTVFYNYAQVRCTECGYMTPTQAGNTTNAARNSAILPWKEACKGAIFQNVAPLV